MKRAWFWFGMALVSIPPVLTLVIYLANTR